MFASLTEIPDLGSHHSISQKISPSTAGFAVTIFKEEGIHFSGHVIAIQSTNAGKNRLKIMEISSRENCRD